MKPDPTDLTFEQAERELKRVGARHAEGDALRCMYARLAADLHGAKPHKLYAWLINHAADNAIADKGRKIVQDRALAWDIIMGAA